MMDLLGRMQRAEQHSYMMLSKQHAMLDTVSRLLQFNYSLSRAVLTLVPTPDHPIHQEGKCSAPPLVVLAPHDGLPEATSVRC
jgi:hypothetical protein